MKVQTALWSFLLFLALSSSGHAQTADSHASESKILALENSWSQAEERQDVKALDALLDDRLLYVHYSGTVWNKAQYLASLKNPTSHEEQGVNETMTARVFGDSAVVIGIYRVKGVENGNLLRAANAILICGFSKTGNGCALPVRSPWFHIKLRAKLSTRSSYRHAFHSSCDSCRCATAAELDPRVG
jgi:ketosteroid isomerase-like protein